MTFEVVRQGSECRRGACDSLNASVVFCCSVESGWSTLFAELSAVCAAASVLRACGVTSARICLSSVAESASVSSASLPMPSYGILLSFARRLLIEPYSDCNPPGTVGSSGGFALRLTSALGAVGKKSAATYSCPVNRLPVRSCARNPCATIQSTRARVSAVTRPSPLPDL